MTELHDSSIHHVGVPEEVINRATLILDAIENNKNVERLCNEKISAKDQQYKVILSRLKSQKKKKKKDYPIVYFMFY